MISLTYKHNVLDLCVIVFTRPNSLGGGGGGGGWEVGWVTRKHIQSTCHGSFQTNQKKGVIVQNILKLLVAGVQIVWNVFAIAM